MKTCTKCNVEKNIDQFYAYRRPSKKTAKNGVASWCKACSNASAIRWGKLNRDKINARNRASSYYKEYYKKNRSAVLDTTWKSRIKTMYGITPEVYESMFRSQNGVCAICERPAINEKLCVDHNHTTGEVRQLLCKSCNVGIARFNEDVVSLSRAIEYIKKHSKVLTGELS